MRSAADTTARRKARWQLVMHRWGDVVACGVVAAILVVLLEPLLATVAAPAVRRLALIHPFELVLLVGVLGLAAAWPFARGRWLGFLGLRYLDTYPPTWIAVLVAFLAASILSSYCGVRSAEGDNLFSSWGATFWSTLALLVILACFAPMFRRLAPRSHTSHVSQPAAPRTLPPDDWPSMQSWLEDDREIDCPERDRFSHDEIARRMAERIIPAASEAPPTMALLGPYGSGKSTIGRLLAHRLAGDHRFCFVQMSLWPYGSPEAAVRGILDTLLRALGKQINTLPLGRLSDDYLGAIEAVSPRVGALLGAVCRPSPQAILERLSDVCRAIGVRIILWIDDLDRFSRACDLDEPARSSREHERLGAVRALLYLLDRCSAVSVIVADTSLHSRFDLDKIARFIERIRPISPDHAWQAIKVLRSHCLHEWPTPIIDPASTEVRALLEPSPGSPLMDWLRKQSKREVPDALAELLATPRVLKSCLRRTWGVWSHLAGEVDFDSVLVANAICLRVPGVFALIERHIPLFKESLRQISVSAASPENPPKPQPVVEEIKHKLQDLSRDEVEASETLLHYLFPTYPPNDSTDFDLARERSLRPQAFFASGRTDYWGRYLREGIGPKEPRDQTILNDIRRWKAGEEDVDLTQYLVDHGTAAGLGSMGKLEQFIRQFDADDGLHLLKELVAKLKDKSASAWRDRSVAPGVYEVARMCRALAISGPTLLCHVRDSIELAMTSNLPLALHLTLVFAQVFKDVDETQPSSYRQRIGRRIRRCLVKHYTGCGAAKRLKGALKGGHPYVIAKIVGWIGPQRRRIGWPRFVRTLLQLALLDPVVGIPPILWMIMEDTEELSHDAEGRPQVTRRPHVDPRSVQYYFAGVEKRLFVLLRRLDMPESFKAFGVIGEPIRERWLVARQSAGSHRP